jgi:alkyl sulfatase BDS1-like metallo-beta-lactamase superfamily hydrolase
MDSLSLALRHSELPEFIVLKGPSDMRVKQSNKNKGFPRVKDGIYKVRGYFISVGQAE